MSAYERLLVALRDNGSRVTQNGSGASAQCPAHDDRSASLSVTSGPEKVLVRCHAGCGTEDVLEALSLSAKDLFDEQQPLRSKAPAIVAAYDYVDESGTVLFQAVRMEPKAFRQRRPDGKGGWDWKLGDVRRVLYRLPAVLDAVKAGTTVYVVEGEKDVHAAEQAGAVATTNPMGAGKWRPEYAAALAGATVIVVADKDTPGRAHAAAIAQSLAGVAASVTVVEPAAGKDLSDHLAAGHGLDELAEPTISEKYVLEQVHEVYRRWLGDGYDLDVLDVVLAVAAAEQLDGDPCWLLVVGGSGAAKTETVVPLAGAGAHVTSTISSEGALLSGSAKKDTAHGATGGLLRKIGATGTVVIKDFTSILSMSREPRGQVLAALREVYDGRWQRNVGVDGGRTLTWEGRLVLLGAVTTAYDSAHGVIAAMGDRFVVVRMDSSSGRSQAGRQAIRNAGREEAMRAELSAAVAGLLSAVRPGPDLELTEVESTTLLGLADVVTLARTAVERDYRGEVIDAHAPEMPTRFAKQLTMLVRGALAIGVDRDHALRLAARCAGDSVPPLRLALLLDLLGHPHSTTYAVRVRLDKPRTTVDQNLQALHLLGLVTVDEVEEGDRGKTRWYYSLAPEVDSEALLRMNYVSGNVGTGAQGHKEEGQEESSVRLGTDVSRHTADWVDTAFDQADFDTRHPKCEDCGGRVDGSLHEATCKAAP